MNGILDKKSMTEEHVKLHFITLVLVSRWGADKITMETSPANILTAGRVRIKGNIPSRDAGRRCDYVLWHIRATPLAVVEAKDNRHSPSAGMQQAI